MLNNILFIVGLVLVFTVTYFTQTTLYALPIAIAFWTRPLCHAYKGKPS